MTNQEHPTGETNIHKESRTTNTTSGRSDTTAGHTKEMSGGYLREGLGRISWGAIFAGVTVALVVMIVLNILGIAVGAGVAEGGAGAEGLGIGAGIWWTVTVLIALFAGGWTTGQFARVQERKDGLMHGIVTWSVFVLASFLAVTTALGQLLGGAFGFIGQNLQAALGTFQPAGTLEATLAQQGIDPAQAAELEATMAATGEQALEALAIGAGWAFIALLLGALVAAFGGAFGTDQPQDRERRGGKRFTGKLRPQRT